MEDLVEAQGLLLLVAQAAQQQPVKATTAATILIAAQQLWGLVAVAVVLVLPGLMVQAM